MPINVKHTEKVITDQISYLYFKMSLFFHYWSNTTTFNTPVESAKAVFRLMGESEHTLLKEESTFLLCVWAMGQPCLFLNACLSDPSPTHGHSFLVWSAPAQAFTATWALGWYWLLPAFLPHFLRCAPIGEDMVSPLAPAPLDQPVLDAPSWLIFSPRTCIFFSLVLHSSQSGTIIRWQKLGFSIIENTKFCALTCFLLEKGD